MMDTLEGVDVLPLRAHFCTEAWEKKISYRSLAYHRKADQLMLVKQ